MKTETCDYCRGIGACPKCWGRAGITRLESQRDALLEACKVIEKAWHEAHADRSNMCDELIYQAFCEKAQNIEPLRAAIQEATQ